MKFPDFTKLENVLLKVSGAVNVKKHNFGTPKERDRRSRFLKKLETKGIDVNINKITTRNSFFELNKEQIVIYIKDHKRIKEKEDLIPIKLNKIHLIECEWIRNNKEIHKRYVASQRKTGWFKIDTKWGETQRRLLPCRYCLSEIYDIINSEGGNGGIENGGIDLGAIYKDFNFASKAKKTEIVEAFNISEFFETYKYEFKDKPIYTDDTARENDYTPDWDKHSYACRERSNWTCQGCSVNLSSHKSLLDAHHKNRVKYDNRPSNLKALCKTCHRKEPRHSHMSTANDEIIERLRKEQGLHSKKHAEGDMH